MDDPGGTQWSQASYNHRTLLAQNFMIKNFTVNLNFVTNLGLSGPQFALFQPVTFKLRILPTWLPLRNSNEI